MSKQWSLWVLRASHQWGFKPVWLRIIDPKHVDQLAEAPPFGSRGCVSTQWQPKTHSQTVVTRMVREGQWYCCLAVAVWFDGHRRYRSQESQQFTTFRHLFLLQFFFFLDGGSNQAPPMYAACLESCPLARPVFAGISTSLSKKWDYGHVGFGEIMINREMFEYAPILKVKFWSLHCVHQ